MPAPTSKPAIVLEWGAVYVRCGVAGEPCPRVRLPSPLGALAVGGERLNETAWRGALDEFVARLFAEELLTMPQKRIVLNVEDAALPRALRRALADALYDAGAERLAFAPSIGVVLLLGIGFGVGNGMFLSVDYALACDTLPSFDSAAQGLGVWGVSAFLGSTIGPLIAGPLLAYFGWTPSPERYSSQGYLAVNCAGAVYVCCAGLFLRHPCSIARNLAGRPCFLRRRWHVVGRKSTVPRLPCGPWRRCSMRVVRSYMLGVPPPNATR